MDGYDSVTYIGVSVYWLRGNVFLTIFYAAWWSKNVTRKPSTHPKTQNP